MGSVPARRPGRPRDARADSVILEAAAAVLAECGHGGFTVDAVAARAGCGKATIYRRWPSRAHLLLETINLAGVDLTDPDTGSVADDLVEVTVRVAAKMRDTPVGALTVATMAEAAVDPTTRQAYTEFVAARRAIPCRIVERGIERGELRPDTDVELVVDMVSGPVFVRVFMTGKPVDDDFVRRTVEVALDGVRNRS